MTNYRCLIYLFVTIAYLLLYYFKWPVNVNNTTVNPATVHACIFSRLLFIVKYLDYL